MNLSSLNLEHSFVNYLTSDLLGPRPLSEGRDEGRRDEASSLKMCSFSTSFDLLGRIEEKILYRSKNSHSESTSD